MALDYKLVVSRSFPSPFKLKLFFSRAFHPDVRADLPFPS